MLETHRQQDEPLVNATIITYTTESNTTILPEMAQSSGEFGKETVNPQCDGFSILLNHSDLNDWENEEYYKLRCVAASVFDTE